MVNAAAHNDKNRNKYKKRKMLQISKIQKLPEKCRTKIIHYIILTKQSKPSNSKKMAQQKC